MKKIICLILGVLFTALPLHAEVSINGSVETDTRTLMTSPYDISYQDYELVVQLAAFPDDLSKVYSELAFTGTGLTAITDSAALSSRDTLSPWRLEIAEAYYRVDNFLVPGLSLKLGRQRIAWGRGDKINPTDNINPDDLSDIWDYGAHLGSDGAKLTYRAGETFFEAAYIPVFTPALLPSGDYRSALTSGASIPASFTVNSMTDRVEQPAPSLEEGYTIAAKVSRMVMGYDLSLSWINGRDDLPLIDRLTITPAAMTGIDVAANLVYPRFNIIGADLAGSIADIGIWAEAALFIPEEIILTTDMRALAMGVRESTALADDPYTKFVLGMDYTFGNGIYVNVQYLHGFIHQRGLYDLNDYLFMNLDWTLLNDTVKITPVGIALELVETSDIQDHYAFLAMPQIEYKPVDNLTLTAGGRWLWGSPDSTFGQLADKDEVFIKGKYQF